MKYHWFMNSITLSIGQQRKDKAIHARAIPLLPNSKSSLGLYNRQSFIGFNWLLPLFLLPNKHTLKLSH